VCRYAAATAAVYAALGAAVVLPPLAQPASGEHHVGKVVWADLVTPDLDAAKRFYGALFGWTFRDGPGDRNYALALLDGEPVAGLFQKALPAGQSKQPGWFTFIAVRDTLMLRSSQLFSTAARCYSNRTIIRSAAARRCWPILMAPRVCRLGGRGRPIRGHCDFHSSGLTEWRPIKLKRRPQRCEKFAAGCSTGV
jgi:hypothetical protein